MDVGVLSLKRICVLKVVEEISHFCPGVPFDELGKFLYVVGPFEYLSSPCTEAIFEYVASTRQLNSSWLSLLLVTHLRTVDLHACPSAVTNSLFKMLLHRCKRLEKLIIPNCTKISNKKLCQVLLQNPSLLHLDISNKNSPKVDSTVVDTLAHSCRNLRVLKLSDHRLDNPKGLLVLCGRVPIVAEREAEEEWNINTQGKRERVVSCSNPFESSTTLVQSGNGQRHSDSGSHRKPQTCSCHPTVECAHGTCRCMQEEEEKEEEEEEGGDCLEPLIVMTNNLSLEEPATTVDIPQQRTQQDDGAQCSNVNRLLSISSLEEDGSLEGDRASWSWRTQPNGLQRYNSSSCSDSEPSSSLVVNGLAGPVGQPEAVFLAGGHPTQEEQENAISNHQRGYAIAGPLGEIVDYPGDGGQENDSDSDTDENGSESEEDLYEDDDEVTNPLPVEDHSAEFGCMELETLCLDYINLDDQVLAVLMQSLPRLRFLNVSDTNIHNPWRLLDSEKGPHLKYLCHLDVRSTALSRTALQLIPKFHPDLQKLSISTTMLPPSTYASIGRLTGVADLELIGGQYYPAPPEDIFKNGIAPAVSSIGKHLVSLNLTFFAHVEFESIVLNCPKIESLDLSYTTISLTHPSPSLATCCPHLSYLNLAFSHVKATKKQEDNREPQPIPEDVALQGMIGGPPNLEELHLDGLGIQDETLQGVFSGISYPLRVLKVSKCNMLSITGVEHVWGRCPLLKTIDLSHCRAITLADHQRFTGRCQRERPRFRVEGSIEWK